MNILYCGDRGIIDGLFLSALSLCAHSKSRLNFYILTAKVGIRQAIGQAEAEKLQKAVSKTNPDNRVTLFDITEIFNSYLPTANLSTRFTPLCMLRLFADKVPKLPSKLLYLDTDVMCRADFSQLYDTDISEFEIAGVPDRYGKWFFGNILKHDYLNSGVLLMNMQKIKESKLFEQCRKICREKRMFMPDQSALNKTAKKLNVHPKYNEQGKIKSDTVFKHFTTFFKFFPYIHTVTVKPWQYDKLHNQLKIFEFDDIISNYEKEYR